MEGLLGFLYICVIPVIVQVDTQEAPKWSCYQQTGSCYYLSEFTRDEPEASCWCRSVGGNLVKIDSGDELQLIRTLIEGAGRLEGFYIGATDKRNEGSFVWEDGTVATSNIPWHVWGDDSEPDNYDNNEHCVALTNKLWWEDPPTTFPEFDAFDVFCSSLIYFVCEQTNDFSNRIWEEVSRDQIYPSAELLSFSGVTKVTCANQCATTCRCLSMAYQENGGNCVLYDRHPSRLTSPQTSPGYVTYD